MNKLTKMIVAASAMLPLATMATTVAYWPLAGENGVWTTQGDVFQNSATPGTMDAISTVIRCRDGYVAPTKGVHAKDYPAGTNAFPTAYGVYDPVAKENLAAATGLDFGTGSFANNWNSDNNCCWIAGALRVADPDALKLSTFTVEFFLKPDLDYKSRTQIIAAMPLETGTHSDYTAVKESWSIKLDGNNHIVATFATTNNATIKTFTSDAVPLFDGRWHHFAFTVSGTTFKMLFDYVVVRSGTLNDNVNYNEDGDLFIGGTTHDIYSYAGHMAHFRVSSEALTSDNFLHFTRTTRAADEPEDVVLHLDFEPVDGLSTNQTVVFNRAATGSAVHLHTADNWQPAAYAQFDTDVYTNKLYVSRKDRKGNENTRSFNKTNTSSQYPYLAWYPVDDIFRDYSFTVEMFMKTSESGKYKSYLRRQLDSGDNSPQLSISTRGTAGKLECGFYKAGITVADTATISESGWHHVAFVYDKTASKFSWFRDWDTKVGEKNVASDIGVAATTPIMLLGWTDATGSKAKIDEVRITKRALGVKEFLTPECAQGLIIFVQ